MILIGLGNKARHGKDSVAKFMQEAIPEIKLYSFGAELKYFCQRNQYAFEELWELTHPGRVLAPSKDDPIYGNGDILQFIGTEVVRHAYPNAWVDALINRIDTEDPKIAVISDVRFLNETKFIKDNGGFLVNVSRKNSDGSPYFDPNRSKTHISEIGLDDYAGWDFYITAKSGEMDDLKIKSLTVLKNIINVVADPVYNFVWGSKEGRTVQFVGRK